jgi:hypothetical protein
VVAAATALVLLYVPAAAAQLPASTCQFSGMAVASVKSVRKNVAVGGLNPESIAAAIVGRIAIRSSSVECLDEPAPFTLRLRLVATAALLHPDRLTKRKSSRTCGVDGAGDCHGLN